MRRTVTGIIMLSVLCVITLTAYSCANNYPKPVNPNATPEAKSLLEMLYRTVDEGKIISGLHHNQLNMPAYRYDLNNIERACGKEPMIWGGDVAWDASRVIELAQENYANGHIITLMWHAARPMDHGIVNFRGQTQGEFSDEQWDELMTVGSDMYNSWLAQVDSISQYLKVLRDHRIPVLWRPYHEMNGEWFWWGWREGERGFKELWKRLYDKMVNYHHLDNLIWVWNANAPRNIPGDTAKDYALFYPGNDYVDVLATDVYNRDWKQSHHDQLIELGKGKLIAIGELGNLPNPSDLDTQNRFAWFMIWTSFTSERYNTQADIKAIFERPGTVCMPE
ncbi:MAG: glycosyl hydrolase family 26 [Bacteroidaceae bacterium]|nr:glycosyl hydrolase family 26 [Bacteroidaceae bacterium]